MRVNGVQEVGGEDVLVHLSHATQERMRDIVEKLTEISQHRTQALKVGLDLLLSFSCSLCLWGSEGNQRGANMF